MAAAADASTIGLFDWQSMMMMLYAISSLILIRCIFRIIEYAIGLEGYLLSYEWPLYVFNALLMVMTMIIFYV